MISWPLMARIPCALCWGYILCLAIIKAYMLFIDPPGAKMESPFSNPMISLIFLKHSCSIRMKTGAISYVNMLVLAVAVNHSPAMDTTSKPVESWLKNRGCPASNNFTLLTIHGLVFSKIWNEFFLEVNKDWSESSIDNTGLIEVCIRSHRSNGPSKISDVFHEKIFFRQAVVGIFRQKNGWLVRWRDRKLDLGHWCIATRVSLLQTNFRKPIFIPKGGFRSLGSQQQHWTWMIGILLCMG